MVYIEKAKIGHCEVLRVSTEINRHLRVEFYGLVRRVFRYAANEVDHEMRRRLVFLGETLEKFHSEFAATCPYLRE